MGRTVAEGWDGTWAILTVNCLILAKSLEKATHTVQFMPAEQTLDPNFSNQKDIEEINVEGKEENEEIYRMV